MKDDEPGGLVLTTIDDYAILAMLSNKPLLRIELHGRLVMFKCPIPERTLTRMLNKLAKAELVERLDNRWTILEQGEIRVRATHAALARISKSFLHEKPTKENK